MGESRIFSDSIRYRVFRLLSHPYASWFHNLQPLAYVPRPTGWGREHSCVVLALCIGLRLFIGHRFGGHD